MKKQRMQLKMMRIKLTLYISIGLDDFVIDDY
jgi:hypothetical protein